MSNITELWRTVDEASRKIPSYAASRKAALSHRVRVFNPDDHDIVGQTETHDRYDCPYCLELRGKEDDDGKFYFDREKQVGHCFKCDAVGIVDDGRPLEEVRYDAVLTAFKSKMVTDTPFNFDSLTPIDYESLFQPLDETAKAYLASRIPFYPQLADYFSFRQLPDSGVTVPILYFGRAISYNLRFYKPRGKMKYYIPAGVKYLYSPTNVFRPNNEYCEVTLVEGVFDAIAATILGLPNPLCVFGSTITSLQIAMLRRISPSKINILLDETHLSWKLYHKIKRTFPTCSKVNVMPAFEDPEEYLGRMLVKWADDPEKLESLLSRLQTLAKEKNNAVRPSSDPE